MQDEFEIGDVDIWGDQREMASPDDTRRTIILQQNKRDMGAHQFTLMERNLMVAETDMPKYDDRPPNVVHYSKMHLKVGIYGLQKLYKDSRRANEELCVIVKKNELLLLKSLVNLYLSVESPTQNLSFHSPVVPNWRS